ncbi:MAG: OsmC family protein [Saprospiraceae bacterium]
MDTHHNYRVDLKWKEGRRGVIASPDLNESIEVATPPDFPKGIEGIWSPEHLFIASVESCIMTTFLAIAENSKLDFNHFSARGTGVLAKVEKRFVVSEINLQVTLEISDILQKEKAIRILEKSEKACLISNSINTKIIFEPIIVIK